MRALGTSASKTCTAPAIKYVPESGKQCTVADNSAATKYISSKYYANAYIVNNNCFNKCGIDTTSSFDSNAAGDGANYCAGNVGSSENTESLEYDMCGGPGTAQKACDQESECIGYEMAANANGQRFRLLKSCAGGFTSSSGIFTYIKQSGGDLPSGVTTVTGNHYTVANQYDAANRGHFIATDCMAPVSGSGTIDSSVSVSNIAGAIKYALDNNMAGVSQASGTYVIYSTAPTWKRANKLKEFPATRLLISIPSGLK